ncbi:MAG: pyridoxal-phosphate-dependent aminotransferase family protein [Gemmatimonadaceae bacterium]
MNDARPFGTFFLPGPTEVRPEVLAAMRQPMIAHRGRAFEELFERLQAGLRDVFRTGRAVFVSGTSGTGMMEAAVRCARPGPVLALVNGSFSDRFARIARACGRDVDVVEAPPGGTVPLELVERQLAGRRYSALTVVHSETSTGALTDVRAVGALCRAYGVLSLVDSVSGVGGAPVECDAWELDLVLTASQKALALPPGLAFAVASEGYLSHVASAPARGLYLDLAEFAAAAGRSQTPTTPALSLLYALERQLADIAAGGITARWSRHAELAAAAWRWADSLAGTVHPQLAALAAPGVRSPTVTAITLPSGLDSATVVNAIEARGFVVGTGNGATRHSTFRIGHMGDHTVPSLERCLAACTDALLDVLARP